MAHSITPQKSDFPNLGQTTSSEMLPWKEPWWITQPQVPNSIWASSPLLILSKNCWLHYLLITWFDFCVIKKSHWQCCTMSTCTYTILTSAGTWYTYVGGYGRAMLTTTIIIGGLHWLEAQLIVRKQKMLLNMRPLSYSRTSFTHLHPAAMRRVSKRKQIHVFPKTFHLLYGQLIKLLFEKQKSSKISTFQIVLWNAVRTTDGKTVLDYPRYCFISIDKIGSSEFEFFCSKRFNVVGTTNKTHLFTSVNHLRFIDQTVGISQKNMLKTCINQTKITCKAGNWESNCCFFVIWVVLTAELQVQNV